jgi:hypothetical protein
MKAINKSYKDYAIIESQKEFKKNLSHPVNQLNLIEAIILKKLF